MLLAAGFHCTGCNCYFNKPQNGNTKNARRWFLLLIPQVLDLVDGAYIVRGFFCQPLILFCRHSSNSKPRASEPSPDKAKTPSRRTHLSLKNVPQSSKIPFRLCILNGNPQEPDDSSNFMSEFGSKLPFSAHTSPARLTLRTLYEHGSGQKAVLLRSCYSE